MQLDQIVLANDLNLPKSFEIYELYGFCMYLLISKQPISKGLVNNRTWVPAPVFHLCHLRCVV